MGRQGACRGQIALTFLLIVGTVDLTRASLAAGTRPLPQQGDTTPNGNRLDDLMTRVGDYVFDFITRYANVVAEEQMVQETTAPRRKRQLRSDFLLVRYPGAVAWLSFRDTFEVDGKPVRSEPDRLTRLFVEPPQNALRRAREITDASAKYNLVNIGTLNFPLLVMSLVQHGYQDRFRFTLSGMEKSLGPDVRTIQFQEFRRPTLLTRDGNGDLFAAGLIWIEQRTGRVVKTQLRLGRVPFQTRVETVFKFDEALGIDVPAEMREWYPEREGEITAVSSYSRFRRFQVQAEDKVN
jgi:hypothetical protein